MHRASAPPIALTIAGSDNSAGAGIQADLKTFTACGVYGLTALTCVVAEVPGKVAAIQAVDPAVLREQIELSLRHFPVAAIKTGLLHSSAAVRLVGGVFEPEGLAAGKILVIDPVMVATSGDALLQRDAVALYRERLFPAATLVTPNLDEARVLLGGGGIGSVADLRAAAKELAACHGTAFLVKGGHLGGDEAVDVLCLRGGELHEFRAPFVPGVTTHGTGCTYSAAITAGLASRLDLVTAVARGKGFVTVAIRDSLRWEHAGRTVEALRHGTA